MMTGGMMGPQALLHQLGASPVALGGSSSATLFSYGATQTPDQTPNHTPNVPTAVPAAQPWQVQRPCLLSLLPYSCL